MNQPALILAVFYAVGVVLGDLFVVPILTLFIVLFIFGFLGLGVHGLARRLSTVVGKQDYHASSLDCVYGLCEIARVVLLMAIVALMGWFNYARHTSLISPYDLRRIIPEKGAIDSVKGRIAAPPKIQRYGTRERVQLSVDVSAISLGEAWQVGYGRIVVTTTNKLGLAYNVGKQIQVDGVLIPPESASSPGLYDYRQQLVRLGIYHELRADALVLAGEFHGVRVILMSDLGRDGRQILIKRNADLRADVLVVSVPDRSSTLGLGILRLIQPKAILVHDCNFPVTERASADWLEQLQSSGAQVFSVRKLGGIRLTVKPGDWRLEDSQGILFSR